MVSVIIGIGFDGTDVPQLFAAQVEAIVERLGEVTATIEGESWSPGWGREPGLWVAGEFPTFDAYLEARARILAVGARHGQDAVAFTVGSVDVASCPTPEPKAQR